ncbi:MAG: GGDEF domain-containing protein [Burkholderiales bacterium]|nr:GGDEF domain-containing protein [Burkholderiales bacterium]
MQIGGVHCACLYPRIHCGPNGHRDIGFDHPVAACAPRHTPTPALRVQTAKRRADTQKHAFFDPLTGLPNRLLLMDRFQRAIQHAKRSRTQFAVLMVDLNKFKAINDTYGHAAGDKVLVTIAQRMVSLVRSTDTVARLGGDEFVLIIESLTEREQIGTLGQKLIDLLAEEILLDSGEAVSLGGSVGFAWYPSDGDSLKDILEVADEAMYFCKTSGLMAL